jgi:putative membrane protein
LHRPQFQAGRLFQGIILFGFSIYLIKLFGTGEIKRLVAPHIQVLLAVTLGVLLILTFYALATLYRRESHDCWAHDHNHDHDHDHDSRPRLSWLLLSAPVVVGLSFPTQSLGADLLANTAIKPPQPVYQKRAEQAAQPATQQGVIPGVNLNGMTADAPKEANTSKLPPEQAAAPDPALRPEDRVDLTQIPKEQIDPQYLPPKPVPGSEVSLVDLYSNILIAPEYYFNQRYRYIGFVYHPPGWPTDRFILVRYMISCCAADGIPLGVTVESKDASKYPDNTWLEIDGTLTTRRIPELDKIPPVSWYAVSEHKPVVLAHTLKPIPEPATPYYTQGGQAASDQVPTNNHQGGTQ